MKNEKYAHRYATTRIQIKDENNEPLVHTKVNAKLVNHEFLFGSGAFDAVTMYTTDADKKIDFYQEFQKIDTNIYADRMEKWTKVFNYGTLPFYWGQYEPTEGDVQFENRIKAAKYLVAKGAKVKGHPLCWHTACADWLMDYDNTTILDKQLKRIDRDVSAFRGLIDMWDVINEVVIMPVYDRYDNAITRICKDLGRVGLVKEVFQAAHTANPDAVLLINDFDLSESYRILIDGCLNAGVPISAIGIQTHQHQGYRGMAWLEDILDRFSVFGIPLHFTENTLISGDIMPSHIVDLNDYQVDEWPSTPEGEERQAREWKEMYERLFAHPLVEAITGWDFADGAWLHAPSGVIREDNTEKPSYYTLKKLIHEEWTTNEDLMTDENGFITLEGYRGRYHITAREHTTEFDLK